MLSALTEKQQVEAGYYSRYTQASTSLALERKQVFVILFSNLQISPLIDAIQLNKLISVLDNIVPEQLI